MIIALLSDIHANFPALDEVLKHARQKNVEKYWFLGDLVGYGPDPEKVLQWFVQNQKDIEWVVGNHDAMLFGLDERQRAAATNGSIQRNKENDFAFQEIEAVQIGRSPGVIGDPIQALNLNLERLMGHPELLESFRKDFSREHIGSKSLIVDDVHYGIVHASRLAEQQMGPYIYSWTEHFLETEIKELLDIYVAGRPDTGMLALMKNIYSSVFGKNKVSTESLPVCQLHGHSHIQTLLVVDSPEHFGKMQPHCIELERAYSLGKTVTVANPGSVGQPRNGDTRACYAILDTVNRTITFHRVRCRVDATVNKMTRSGYPSNLVDRLVSARQPDGVPIEWQDCHQKQGNQE